MVFFINLVLFDIVFVVEVLLVFFSSGCHCCSCLSVSVSVNGQITFRPPRKGGTFSTLTSKRLLRDTYSFLSRARRTTGKS